MAGRRKRESGRRKRLDTSLAGALRGEVPVRWVKGFAAVFLLPPAWVLTKTFFGVFAFLTIERAFWLSEEFWFFGLGVALWLILFFSAPRPLWVYVFGHELTHAIWVLLLGGRVQSMRVSSSGGHVLADRVNTWIALSPYFFPIYSVLWLLAFFVTGLFLDLEPFRPLLFGGIGFTWAFHFSFTCWMIPKGQSDLHYGGYFFSLVVVYIANLAVLSLFLILGTSQVDWRLFAVELYHNSAEFLDSCESLVRRLL